MNNIYKLVKRKRIDNIIFKNYLLTNQIDIESIKQFKNTWGESLLTYSIKYGSNIEFFEFLYQNGFVLTGNFYDMTPIDICVSYNKNTTNQKLAILDWLYSKDVQFNPFYLLVYPRTITNWIRSKEWVLDINKQNQIGNTALHEVCKLFHHNHPSSIYNKINDNNSYDAFYILLEMDADPHIKNNYNNTCIDYCIKNSLMNNLNILYYFHYELTPIEINELMECDNYFKLIKNTIWLLINHQMLHINNYNKNELENKLLEKIIKTQLNTTSYYSDYNSILRDINDKIFFDNIYNLKMCKIEENMFFESD